MLQHAALWGLQAHPRARRLRVFQPPPRGCRCKPHLAGPGPPTARSHALRLQAARCPMEGPGGKWAPRRGAEGQASDPGAGGGQLNCQRRPRPSRLSSHCCLPRPRGESSRVQVLGGPPGWQSQRACGQQFPSRVVIAGSGHRSSQPPSCRDAECPGLSPGHPAEPGDPPSGSPSDQSLCGPSVSWPSRHPRWHPIGLQDTAGPGEVLPDSWSRPQPWPSWHGLSPCQCAFWGQQQGAGAELPPEGPSQAWGHWCSGTWQALPGSEIPWQNRRATSKSSSQAVTGAVSPDPPCED